MNQIVQILVFGMATSGIYALMAVGVTLIFGVGRVINFAHGAFYAMGAYLAFFFSVYLGMGVWLGTALAILSTAIFAAAFDRYFISPRRQDHILIWMMTFALAFAIREMTIVLAGSQPYSIQSLVPGSIDILGQTIEAQRVLVVCVSVVALLLLWLLLHKTQLGRGLRAVAQHEEAAQLMGIRVKWAYAMVMGMSAGCAALAGILIAPLSIITPDMGLEALLMAFTIVILGGIGSLKGTLLASLIVGYGSTLVSFLITPQLVTVLSLIAIFAVLVWRPSGLFGTAVEERG